MQMQSWGFRTKTVSPSQKNACVLWLLEKIKRDGSLRKAWEGQELFGWQSASMANSSTLCEQHGKTYIIVSVDLKGTRKIYDLK